MIAQMAKEEHCDFMLINFNDEKEMTFPCMNNGTGMMTAKMFIDNGGKIITCSIHKGGSIGTHRHETSDDIKYCQAKAKRFVMVLKKLFRQDAAISAKKAVSIVFSIRAVII